MIGWGADEYGDRRILWMVIELYHYLKKSLPDDDILGNKAYFRLLDHVQMSVMPPLREKKYCQKRPRLSGKGRTKVKAKKMFQLLSSLSRYM